MCDVASACNCALGRPLIRICAPDVFFFLYVGCGVEFASSNRPLCDLVGPGIF